MFSTMTHSPNKKNLNYCNSGSMSIDRKAFNNRSLKLIHSNNYNNNNNTNNNNIININNNKSSSQTNITQTDANKQHQGSRGNTLERNSNVFRSSQSLCSCDGVTEVNPDLNRPLYYYSLDRKKPLHTYTCEQNAHIIMRLEKERQIKLGSTGKLNNSTSIKNQRDNNNEKYLFNYSNLYPETTFIESNINNNNNNNNNLIINNNNNNNDNNNDMSDVDNIPPPPPALHRTHSFSRQYLQSSSPAPEKLTSKLNDCTLTLLNCANTGYAERPPINRPDICKMTKVIDPTTVDKNKEEKEIITDSKLDWMKKKLYDQYKNEQEFHDHDIYHNNYRDDVCKENESLYFYHHEPPYMPNFDNLNYETKFNTIGPISKSIYNNHSQYMDNINCNKYHISTCNLNKFANQNNLLGDRCFSHSLSNFNLAHAHHNHFSTMPFAQYHSIVGGVPDATIISGPYNTKATSGHLIPKNQYRDFHTGTPTWRHRQYSSRGSSSSGNSSSRWDAPSRHWLAVTSILLIAGAAGVAVPLALRVTAGAPFEERLQVATQLLDSVPLIDGHNDLPWNIRKFLHNQLNDFNFDDLRNTMPWAKSHWSHTDLQRLKLGRVTAQFWAAYVPCEAQHRDAVQLTLEQIDVIRRLTERYSPHLISCTLASDILGAHEKQQVCSLIGVEGGHSLGGSLAVLRTFYAIGVRYMTLTSTCHTPWADSSSADAPKFDIKHGGLTAFGKTIIREMNRLGMIVDLSHVSVGTMRDALAISEAPVIFSHSSAYELCNSSRNVQDDILKLVAKNRGLVMVNFYSRFLSCSENSTIHDVVAHITHIKHVAGIDHVGLGAGFDGINYVPKGLDDVSTYPMLFAELLADGWTIEELTKLAGQNFIRVMEDVERYRDTQRALGVRPYEDVANFRADDPYNCTTS